MPSGFSSTASASSAALGSVVNRYTFPESAPFSLPGQPTAKCLLSLANAMAVTCSEV